MENKNSKKVKLFLFLAIAVVVLLVVISVVQIININVLKSRLNEKQDELNRLYEQHEYYENQNEAVK